ncbi:hypothetical protein Pla52o_24710 [Novipirellula galeiformis]|uniref:Uncharacterized protein n=2 Tax=Novipirellula galeiformis TaxID=2528004 RepID=A0A5C6CF83_9BACT|nr:hypothetical protein Pla52o_24710 [Novipirellula galeiformis]
MRWLEVSFFMPRFGCCIPYSFSRLTLALPNRLDRRRMTVIAMFSRRLTPFFLLAITMGVGCSRNAESPNAVPAPQPHPTTGVTSVENTATVENTANPELSAVPSPAPKVTPPPTSPPAPSTTPQPQAQPQAQAPPPTEPRQLPRVDTKAKQDDSVMSTSPPDDEANRSPSPADAAEPVAEEEEKSPRQYLSEQLLPPAGAKRLSKESLLWVDRNLNRVYIDGYIAMDRGALEMFACPVGSKEHESIVAVVAKSSEVHAALLAIGAQSGTTAMFNPSFVPPTGQTIRVWACWHDKQGKFHVTDARRWVQNVDTKEAVEADWVFAGSGFYKDEEDGREYYRADGGDMICVSNFSTAMMDLSLASSADADSLMFQPFQGRVPERGTPVRLILVPIPVPTDAPTPKLTPQQDPNVAPSEEVLQKRAQAPKTDSGEDGE